MGDRDIRGAFLVVGVPHYVVFLRDDLWSQDIVPLGRAIRMHRELQPAGANVNFVVVRGEHEIEVRTYERGVEDETLACGTGVVASALLFAATENDRGPITVITRGGDELQVSFEKSGDEFRNVTLTGPADFVFEGTIEM